MKIILLLKAKIQTPTFSGHKLQGRTVFQGMKISIENRKGSVRKGKDKDGTEWRTKMLIPYGYFLGTIGKDGNDTHRDHVDCFIGENKKSDKVFIIHQIFPETGMYDEDKVMLGFNRKDEAKKMYLKHYDSDKYYGTMSIMSIDEFKNKVYGEKKGKKIV